MRAFLVMTKNNMKLLIRSIAFILCLICIPFGASAILVLQKNVEIKGVENNMYETNRVASISGDSSCAAVVLIDTSSDKESFMLAEYLARDSSIKLVRWQREPMTEDELNSIANEFHANGYITDIIFISTDFGKNIAAGKQPRLISVQGREDDRAKLVEAKINSFIALMIYYANQTQNEEEMLAAAKKTIEEIPTVSTQVIGNDIKELDYQQSNNLSVIGYSLAIIVLGFVLSGAFVANLITVERSNKSILRINLSGVSIISYTAAKAAAAVITAIIQTAVYALSTALIVGTDIGIPYGVYITFIGTVGIIFNLLSVTFGIYFRSSLTTIYSAAGVWMISNLFSKLYFSFLSEDAFPKWWNNISLLTPQSWVMIASKRIMLGEDGSMAIFFTVMAGFAIVILSAGVIGTKLNSREP